MTPRELALALSAKLLAKERLIIARALRAAAKMYDDDVAEVLKTIAGQIQRGEYRNATQDAR